MRSTVRPLAGAEHARDGTGVHLLAWRGQARVWRAAVLVLCVYLGGWLQGADGGDAGGARDMAPCERMRALPRREDEGDATLITAIFRGSSEGLRAILAAAAGDPSACFVDVVVARDVPAETAAVAQALVDEMVPSPADQSAAGGHRDGPLHGFRVRVVDGAEGQGMGGAEQGGAGCRWAGYHVIMEDGIAYPEGYLDAVRHAVDSVARRAIVGYAGFVWNAHFVRAGMPYSEATYNVLARLAGQADMDIWVDVLRLGTVAFHADISFHHARASLVPWALEPAHFAARWTGLEDIQLAVEAHYHDVPRLLCNHPADWLRDRTPPAHLLEAHWWWDRRAFPALRPVVVGAEGLSGRGGAAAAAAAAAAAVKASDKAALRLAVQFAPWNVKTLVVNVLCVCVCVCVCVRACGVCESMRGKEGDRREQERERAPRERARARAPARKSEREMEREREREGRTGSLCLYSYMCIHICMFIHVYSCMHIHICMFVYAYSCIHIHICIFIYAYSYMHIHICTFIHAYSHRTW